MRHSTGRGTRVRHSTAGEWDEIEKAKKRSGYQELKHSTGENPAVKHATGVEFDYKALSKEKESDEGLPSKVRSKPIQEGDEYLEQYHKSLSQKIRENREDTEYNKETDSTTEKQRINKYAKKMVIEY